MDSLTLGLKAVLPRALRPRTTIRHWESEYDRLVRERLKRSISEKGLRLRDLSVALGVHLSVIGRVLNGDKALPKAWTKPLARHLRLEPEAIWEGWVSIPRQRRISPQRRQRTDFARQQLRALMASNAMSQSRAAIAIGVSPAFMSKVLTGRKRLPPAWYALLATFFGVSPSFFEKR